MKSWLSYLFGRSEEGEDELDAEKWQRHQEHSAMQTSIDIALLKIKKAEEHCKNLNELYKMMNEGIEACHSRMNLFYNELSRLEKKDKGKKCKKKK